MAPLGEGATPDTVLAVSDLGVTMGTQVIIEDLSLPYVRDLPLTVADFFTLERPTTVDVGAALRAVGLDAQLTSQPTGVLSAGQFQRVLIA